MKQNILGIGTYFSSLNFNNFQETSFSSLKSLLDFDAIIINANSIWKNYQSYQKYENKPLLCESDSKQIVDDCNRIKIQLVDLLESGKNVFILIDINENCVIYTGKKEFSGTGKNTRQTNIVTEFDVYSFLPFKFKVTHCYYGDNVGTCLRSPFNEFFNNVKGLYHYAAYFDVSERNSILKIKNSEKVISAILEFKKGKIIFLPAPFWENNYKYKKDWQEFGKLFLNELFLLNEKLNINLDDFNLPEWTNKVTILDEQRQKDNLVKLESKLGDLTNRIEKAKLSLTALQKYKVALTSTGTQLEEIIKQILKELDIKLLDTEKGRSDIIAEYNSIKIVAEIKGVSKSAAEKNAAQLEKWVALFIEEYNAIPKPILIVNAFCSQSLLERTEDPFPNQMLSYSIARNHCLITTTQLLCLYIEIKRHPEYKEERITELLNTVGIYNKFAIENYLL